MFVLVNPGWPSRHAYLSSLEKADYGCVMSVTFPGLVTPRLSLINT